MVHCFVCSIPTRDTPIIYLLYYIPWFDRKCNFYRLMCPPSTCVSKYTVQYFATLLDVFLSWSKNVWGNYWIAAILLRPSFCCLFILIFISEISQQFPRLSDQTSQLGHTYFDYKLHYLINKRHGSRTLLQMIWLWNHPTQKFTSMNLLQMPFVIMWTQSFLSSEGIYNFALRL